MCLQFRLQYSILMSRFRKKVVIQICLDITGYNYKVTITQVLVYLNVPRMFVGLYDFPLTSAHRLEALVQDIKCAL